LAELLDLASQVKFAHWNVRGLQFYSLHQLFDAFASTLNEQIDTVAERIVTLGGVAYGTVRQAATESSLPEFPSQSGEALVVITALAERTAQVGKAVRGLIDVSSAQDADTADILTGVLRDLDKNLWFLEAHVS
jgi:starvation-inducible DNA-binding protein